ncbi:MAG: class I SAM-dependent methyltransferase [Armatimonadetes bacterium]|nr:class I SAM-dependent methyltransferase [Armatimonadota bacterium]
MKGSHYFSPKPSSRDERGIIETVLRGRRFSFITSTGVFSSKKIDNGTRVLVENMSVPERGAFLDMGCGIGVIGLVAASLETHLEVHLSDINQRAVKLTRLNVKRLKLTNCHVYEGNLYEALGDKRFDIIVSNPPVSAGMYNVVKPLVAGAYERLTKGGLIQMVIQTNKGGRILSGFLDEVFGSHMLVARRSGYRVLSAHKPD